MITTFVFFSMGLSACSGATISATPFPTLATNQTPTLSPLTDTFTNDSTASGQTNPTSTCAISTDLTYGYTPENPIKVGDRGFSDRLPEVKFLENLSGPKGEWLSYEKTDTVQSGDISLDVFTITGLDKNITLYIDTQSFSELKAPVGLTCYGRFSD
ncbi:MAG: hypothetical protein U0Z26_04535 [Anaerolineales bacterium]